MIGFVIFLYISYVYGQHMHVHNNVCSLTRWRAAHWCLFTFCYLYIFSNLIVYGWSSAWNEFTSIIMLYTNEMETRNLCAIVYICLVCVMSEGYDFFWCVRDNGRREETSKMKSDSFSLYIYALLHPSNTFGLVRTLFSLCSNVGMLLCCMYILAFI